MYSRNYAFLRCSFCTGSRAHLHIIIVVSMETLQDQISNYEEQVFLRSLLYNDKYLDKLSTSANSRG